MNYKNFRVGKATVGPNYPVFIVAEMSGNHGGSLEKALEIVREAAHAGASAIKLQTYTADTITLKSDSTDFHLNKGPWAEYRNLWELYNAAHTPWAWHPEIFKEATRLGLEVFSSPFDETAVDFLESLQVVAYKIASPEINHIPLLKRVALTKKPVFISTGLATLEDIELAVGTLRRNGSGDIAIMKCTTAYPAPVSEANLRNIPDIATRFNTVTGFSDHSVGSALAVAAVALGACIVEKHIAIEGSDKTVDSFFSLGHRSFTKFVEDIRSVERGLGGTAYQLSPSAEANRSGMRSIYVANYIPKGSLISPENIRCVRPGLGLHPKYYESVIGKKTTSNLFPGQPLKLEDINF